MPSSSLTDLLSQLIATPSVNPAHSGDLSIHSEKRMADLFETLFRQRGLDCEVLPLMGQQRPAVIGRSTPATIRSTLMFEMHLDTVGVADMTIDPFKAGIQDGKLYGRGACDMKGSMAALFHILTPERIQSLSDRGIQLILVGAPDEETGLGGSNLLSEKGIGADAAIVLEPTGCLPVIAHKGALWFDIELRGKSGHGSQPEKGISTNAALAEFLPVLFKIHQDLAEKFTHPMLGSSTLNIGKISGGQTYNIIPERTLLQLDRRVIPNEPEHLFPEQVTKVIEEMIHSGHLLSGTCTLTSHTIPFATDEESQLVRNLQHSISHITGEPATCYGTSWVSDASPFSQTCPQILVFGPGYIAQAHTDNEYIEIEQLERGAKILAHFLDHVTAT